MRRLLLKQLLRMTRTKRVPLIHEPDTLETDVVMGVTTSENFFKPYHYSGGFHFPTILAKVRKGGVESLNVYEKMFWNLHTDHRTAMADRLTYVSETYGDDEVTMKKVWDLYRRGGPETRQTLEGTLAKVARNPRIRDNVNKMLANIESSRKIREAFSKAKPEQWKIMERLIETKDLDPIRTGNIVTKLPTNMMVSAFTDRDFAKLVNADYKKKLDFKYARVINKGNVEKAMVSLREHILGEQYHLSEYQRAQLEILMDDMTVDDFDNFYKSRFGHIVNEVFYSSDSRMMMQTTPYELFDDDVDPPKPGRTMGITEKDKIFNKFVSSLQVYMGVDDDTLDALVWEKLGRKG